MAINMKFDSLGNPEPPSIVLANRNGNKIGQLNVDVKSIDVKDLLKTSEFSFTLNKYIDDKITPHWDKVVDFKAVYCPEWDLWYEIKVELDEATETIKTVFCTQLAQAELSQIKVYNIEINTEDDIARDDYKISILYDEDNPDASILHRVMSKAPHYSIAYIDESLKRIQKSFSFDDSSICDIFDEIEEEVGCVVIYNSNSDKGGMPKRDVSIYDLYQHCEDCGYREEIIGDECPKCHSKNIVDGYGEDTTIFVTSDELATEGIQLVTDTDSVKNCFKLEAGDDLMTATIRNCNPNGSDYIWYFSDAVKEDMSKELVEAIESYDNKYKEHYDSHISHLDETLVTKYNALVDKYKEYYNTDSTCINCDYKGEFENECPSCHSGNILSGKSLQTIDANVAGYPSLMTAYYNTIDLLLYLKSGLMPNVEMSETKAEEQLKLLTSTSLSPVAVNVKDIVNASLSTANSAVLSMAKVLIRPTYKVEIKEGSSSLSGLLSDDNGQYKTWTGKFVITNYSDAEDTAANGDDEAPISVRINNDTETFIEQKIEKTLNKENTDDYSIAGLFAKAINLDENGEHIVDAQGNCQCEFCSELKKYALNPLDSFYKASDGCISILTEQGAGNKDDKVLYEDLYLPYYRKAQSIAVEMKRREDEIAIIEGVWNESDEDNPQCIVDGLQQSIEKCQKEIQEELNFENHLGEDLWLEFCTYRREDKYSNSNYISDGLNNAELFKRANEFIEVAENEIFKSAELQHSISATLNNLLAVPKFKRLVKCFKTGNWIRVRADDKIYKLRLLEYEISYGNIETIPVEFSDVTKVKNGITDVESAISQAASIASSYDSVQRQAKKGNVARKTIDQWLLDGLNNADVEIKNNNSEEVLITKNGLLARSYSDITGEYAPEQLKITHNIMAYTEDNWETVSSALGYHQYQKWKDNQWITDRDYGLSSKFVTAGYVTGSQIIGGEIVSYNYELGDEPKGTYINLIDGDFEFAGGKIVYDSQKNKVTLSGVTIQWDNVNKPTIENIDGLSGITDDIRAIEQGLQATTINEQYVISPNIVGGYLNIKNDNNVGVVIDPDEDYIFQVYNSSGTTTIGADKNGNAEFSGTINGSHFVGGDLLIGDKNKVGDYAEIANDGTLTCTNVYIQGGTLEIGSKNKEETHTWISTDGTLNTYNANISGEVRATRGTFANGTFDNCTINDTCTISGELSGATGTFSGTVSASTIEGSTIEGGSLLIGNQNSGYYAWISENGVLNAEGANITGIINATEGGTIGGWHIDDNGISKVRETTLANEDTRHQTVSMFAPLKDSDKVFFIDDITVADDGASIMKESHPFYVRADGYLHAEDAYIDGIIKAKAGGTIGGFTIDNNSIRHTKTSYKETTNDGVYLGIDGIGLGKGKFYVQNDGYLYASNAYIDGIIHARSGGTIGGFAIDDDSVRHTKTSYNETGNDGVYLGTSGIGLGKGKFYVRNDGYLYTSFGQIGDFQIEDGWLNANTSAGIRCTANDYRTTMYSDGISFSYLDGTVYRYGGHIYARQGYVELSGTWKNENGATITSDANQKHDIELLDERYSSFFDNLIPRRFKYNNGTSNRYHSGYIAQEVQKALKDADISEGEFAGIVTFDRGTDEEISGLRYSEFVTLNTHEIQKLKARVSELENKLKELG